MERSPAQHGVRLRHDRNSVFVNTVENAEWTNTIWKWSDRTTHEKLVEKCGYIYEEQEFG